MIYKQSPWVVSDLSSWQDIIDALRLKSYPVKKGTVVYNQGSPSGKVYVIKSGRVNISIADRQGDEKCLFVLGKGCAFGEIALLSEGAKRSSATAVSPVVLYEISGEHILEGLKADIVLNQAIIKNLLKKINLLTSQVELLCFYDSSYRVIENIYWLMEQFGNPCEDGGVLIEMKFTHQEMANLVGATRVTITNIFLKMEHEGLIEKRKNGLYVRDPERLREYIEEKR